MKRIILTLPSPYVGLRPFTEAESLLFFGRDAHVRDLLAKLERKQRFLAVLGASGTGKSSLVRAGLIPALHRGALHLRGLESSESTSSQRWNVCIFKPGDAPLGQLAHALTEDPRWVDSADRAASESSLGTLLGGSPLVLADLYRQKATLFGGEALLLVVDQFEEIFRYRQRNPDEADSFVKLLLRSASEDVPIYVVITMRSDFLGNAVASHGLAEAINSGIYLTPRLGAEQIRAVITSPLSLVGGSIDPVLANRLVNTLSGEDELPVLEHALLRMWVRARSLGRSTIETSDFVAVCASRDQPGEPTLAFAIDNHASDIHDALTPFQRGIARQFFLSLVERRDGRDVRRPQSLRELRSQVGTDAQDALMQVIEAFRAPGVGFVLPEHGQSLRPDDLIDISHESLIRRWRRFQAWLAEEEIDVAELREWQQRAQRRMDGGGWLDENDSQRAQRWRARVSDRSQARLWAARHAGPGSYEFVDAYIQSSLERSAQVKAEQEALKREAEEARVKRFEVEAELQRAAAERAAADKAQADKEKESALAIANVSRRRSQVAIAGALAALVFGTLAAVFWFQARQALRNANESAGIAKELATIAQAGELATTAERLGKDFPDQSLLLALEARRLAPVPTADALLRAADATYPYRAILRGHDASVNGAQFSPDGKMVLTASDDKTAWLWDAASSKTLRTLRGHEDRVTSAQWAVDGTTVLTSSRDRTARLWEADSGQELQALRGHEAAVVSAQFSPDGKMVLTASDDKTARLWDAAGGQELRVLRGHEESVVSAQFSPNGTTVLTSSRDRTARLWDVASGQALRVLNGHVAAVVSAEFSHDGKMVLTASDDTTARLWDAASGEELRALRGHQGAVVGGQFSADGTMVLTAGADATARQWDVASGQEVRALRGHESGVVSAQFSADGTTVLTASTDRTARLWEAASGKERQALRGHEGAVMSAQFSADGTTVLTASADNTARLWEGASGKERRALRGRANDKPGLDPNFMLGGRVVAQFSPDGKTVLTSFDNTARLWEEASGQELQVLRGHAGRAGGILGDMLALLAAKFGPTSLRSGRFSADGKTVLTAGDDRTARLWDAASGRELRALRGHEGAVASAEFSPDGRMVLTASDDKTARLWDATSGQELRVLRGHEEAVVSAKFSAAGTTVLTASRDKTARLWDAASGQELRVLRGHEDALVSAQFSPDGKMVLTASDDTTARLWDAASGQELRALRGHQGAVVSAQFSADGTTVLTASRDTTARLWDAASGKERQALLGHQGPVVSAQFSADGATVLTASRDTTARLWDAASGHELRALRRHENAVLSAQFSPDGKTVLTASAYRIARLWDCAECQPVPVEELALRVARKVGRELTDDERRRFGIAPAPSAKR